MVSAGHWVGPESGDQGPAITLGPHLPAPTPPGTSEAAGLFSSGPGAPGGPSTRPRSQQASCRSRSRSCSLPGTVAPSLAGGAPALVWPRGGGGGNGASSRAVLRGRQREAGAPRGDGDACSRRTLHSPPRERPVTSWLPRLRGSDGSGEDKRESQRRALLPLLLHGRPLQPPAGEPGPAGAQVSGSRAEAVRGGPARRGPRGAAAGEVACRRFPLRGGGAVLSGCGWLFLSYREKAHSI